MTIVDLDRYKMQVKPKSVGENYKGTRYVLQFNPTADPGERWSYIVKYIRTYEYTGYASTEGGARTAARSQISKLVTRESKIS